MNIPLLSKSGQLTGERVNIELPLFDQDLKLEISLAETHPWPGLIIRAAARVNGALTRLRKLTPHGNTFTINENGLHCDPLDGLIVRTLLGLPSADGVAFRATGDQFAQLLTMLRQASPAIKRQESPRIAACQIFSHAPQAQLAFKLLSGSDENVRVETLPSYRCSDSHKPLGLPIYQGPEHWIFENAITPVGEKVEAPELQALFAGGTFGQREFKGEAALTLIRVACDKEQRAVIVTLPADLSGLAQAVPLQPVLRVEPVAEGESGSVKAVLRFEAPAAYVNKHATLTGKTTQVIVTPEEILKAAENGQAVLRQPDGLWMQVSAETVSLARESLSSIVRRNGTADSFEAQGEEVPELLEWARDRQRDADSPWNVYVHEAVSGAHRVKDQPAELRIRMDVEEDGENAWFSMDASLDVNGQALTEDEIQELIKNRTKWVRKGNDWQRFDQKKYLEFQKQISKQGFTRRRYGARGFRYRIQSEARDRVVDLFSVLGTVEHTERYKDFLDRLKGFEKVEPAEAPKGMAMSLRSYQAQGYSWMKFLAKYGLNGILADEMGLGKTAQTIAQITAQREELGPWPSLIVCPTSLSDNWCKEFARFSPGIKVLRYSGYPGRRDRLRKQFHGYDVVVATYATARNDASLLQKEQWRYVILDEAHTIKNSAAATTKAIKTIPARHRLALTGTPVQNRLDELWSLFDFLMPGYLGRYAHFFREYEEPIAKGQGPRVTPEDKERAEICGQRLRDRIKPFILRRLKTEVARDLPPKIIQDIPCSLSADQVALYQQFAESDEARSAVKQVIEKGAGNAQTQILAALTSLRKICNHPDLMYLTKEVAKGKKIVPLEGYEKRSGKLEALADLLDQCKSGGHRALIFCQLTSMLDIIEHFLAHRNEKYLRLDGSTPGEDRQALVERFNAEKEILAFMISTRAGGSGLNLTGADTVIFYDHDWNPANDRQAQDRAYRIGQTRVVNVYRLVTQGTLEEKILERQVMKQELADLIVQHDRSGFKDLSREDLVNLFTYTPGKDEKENADEKPSA